MSDGFSCARVRSSSNDPKQGQQAVAEVHRRLVARQVEQHAARRELRRSVAEVAMTTLEHVYGSIP